MCLIKCPKNCLLIRQLSNEHSLYLHTTVSSVFTPGWAKKNFGCKKRWRRKNVSCLHREQLLLVWMSQTKSLYKLWLTYSVFTIYFRLVASAYYLIKRQIHSSKRLEITLRIREIQNVFLLHMKSPYEIAYIKAISRCDVPWSRLESFIVW